MKMVCRVAALLAVAHANLSTGIDDLSVSLLQTRAEKIHRPHQQKASTQDGAELKHTDHHSAEEGHKKQMDVSMGQVVKEKKGRDSADKFVKEDFTAKSDIAKLVHQVKVLAKDEAKVSKEVAKEVHTVKQNPETDHKDPEEMIDEAEAKELTQKGGALDFLDDILGRPMAGKDVDLAEGVTHKKGTKDHLDDKVEGKEAKVNAKKEHTDQDGQKKTAKEAEPAEPAELVNLEAVHKKPAEKTKKDKGQGKKHPPGHLNLNSVHKDKKVSQGDEKKDKEKGTKEHLNPLNFDVTEPASKKSEPTQVHFKGTELAKTAVHLDEMTSKTKTAKLFEEDLAFRSKQAKDEAWMSEHSKTAEKETGTVKQLEESLKIGLQEAKEAVRKNAEHSKVAEKETHTAKQLEESLKVGLQEATEAVGKNAEHSKTAEKETGTAKQIEESLKIGLQEAKEAVGKNSEHSKVAKKETRTAKQLEESLKVGLQEATEEARQNAEHSKDPTKHHLNSQSTRAADKSLAKYHPGWKLYELEGGQQRDLISKQVEQSDNETAHHKVHHKHHENLVSEAMGAAFGDSDTAQIVAEDHKEAKLYSSTAAEDTDDTEEFWGEEDPSDIDREFTVEGIPMTSALGEDVETASLNKIDNLEKTKHAQSRKHADSTKIDDSSVVKDSHVTTKATKSETGSTWASTSHRRSRQLSQGEMCDSVSALDFSAATITHSNLGGVGPDSGEETLVYSGITNQDGFVVDLVVTATSPYQPRDASKNGLQDDFGVINLEINSAVDLLFRFMSGGEAFVMNSFYFTFFDLDQGRAHEAREKATIRGFDSYSLSDGTSLEVEELGDSSAIFSSSMRGGKVDNPTSPLSLSHLQRERSVVVTLSDVSEFSVQLSEENYASSQGRNWFFAGPSSIVCSRESKCSTYECPDGYHIRTMAEFLVCAGSPCTRHDRDTCCYEEEEEEDDDTAEADLYSKSASGVLDSKSASDVNTERAKTKIKSAKHY